MRPGSRIRNPRAFTLLEVTVYSALLLVLMGGVYAVVIGGFKYLRLAQAHETVNQQAAIGMKRITMELANASQSGYVVGGPAADQHIMFLSMSGPLPADPDDRTFQGAQVEWKKWVCFYRNGNGQLVRAERPLAGPATDPSVPAPPNFAADILPLPANPIAQNVDKLDFAPAGAAIIRVILETRVDTSSDHLTNLRLESSVRLINL
jgi:Prokaryotic N-terminal methylation motif